VTASVWLLSARFFFKLSSYLAIIFIAVVLSLHICLLVRVFEPLHPNRLCIEAGGYRQLWDGLIPGVSRNPTAGNDGTATFSSIALQYSILCIETQKNRQSLFIVWSSAVLFGSGNDVDVSFDSFAKKSVFNAHIWSARFMTKIYKVIRIKCQQTETHVA